MWERLSPTLTLPDELFLADAALVAESHRRCRDAGVPVDLDRVPGPPGTDETGALLARQHRLAIASGEVYRDAYRTMPRRKVLLLLTDSDARIVSLYSSPEVVCSAADIGIRIGASLAELDCGSNAVAFALRCRQPIATRSQQHYCRVFWNWCSVAAPLLGATGNLLGCVQLSGPAEDGLGQMQAVAGLLAARLAQHADASASLDDDRGDRLPLSDTAVSGMQRRILQLLMQGKTYKQIAGEIGRSTRTVESQLEKLRQQAGVRTTAQLIAKVSDRLSRYTI